MAIDNSVFIRQGTPAGTLTDKYSSNPGMLFSKNLDIFSSSNSFKATAWGGVNAVEEGIVDTDPTGRFELHSDGRVYDTLNREYLNGTGFNFGCINKIDYGGGNEDPTKGIPLKLIVEWDSQGINWKTIVVVTSTIIYQILNSSFKPELQIFNLEGCTLNNGVITVSGNPTYIEFDVCYDYVGFFYTGLKLTKKKKTTGTPYGDLIIDSIKANYPNLVYNGNDNDKIDYKGTVRAYTLNYPETTDAYYTSDPALWILDDNDEAIINIGDVPGYAQGTAGTKACLHVRLENVKEDDNSFNGTLELSIPDDFKTKTYTSFLPAYNLRKVVKQGESYVISNLYTAGVYQFEPTYYDDQVMYNTESRYDFLQESELPWRKGEEFADLVVTDAILYRFGNKNSIGYITKASVDDPAGEGAVTTTYPGIKFIGAVRYNDIIYIIADDRGICGLYAYNGTELVKIISANEIRYENNLVDNNELFKFKIIDMWRDNILLGSTDGRVFMYGNTYGGKGLTVIYETDSGESIEGFSLGEDSLSICTKIGSTYYFREYLGDKAVKTYKTEYEVVYPMLIGTHYVEKESYDLHASYILPSSNCSIEFWVAVNHYHFWTFKCTTDSDIPQKDQQGNDIQYKVAGFKGNYYLRFLEHFGNIYTFELVGDLPVQINTSKIISATGVSSLTFTSFNHFKRLESISSNGYTEGFHREFNISNKINLPKSHCIQLMIKGKGTEDYTPEVFSVNLVANQRDRG